MNIDDSGCLIGRLKLMTCFASMFAFMRSCRIIILLFYFSTTVSNKSEVDALADLQVIERWLKSIRDLILFNNFRG